MQHQLLRQTLAGLFPQLGNRHGLLLLETLVLHGCVQACADGATIERYEHAVISYETKDGKTVKLAEPRNEYEAEMAKGEQKARSP